MLLPGSITRAHQEMGKRHDRDQCTDGGSSPLVRAEEDHTCCAPLEKHTQRQGSLIAPCHIAQHPYAGGTKCKGELIEGHDQTDNLAKMLLGKLMLDDQPW